MFPDIDKLPRQLPELLCIHLDFSSFQSLLIMNGIIIGLVPMSSIRFRILHTHEFSWGCGLGENRSRDFDRPSPWSSSVFFFIGLNQFFITLAFVVVTLVTERLKVRGVKEIFADRPGYDVIHDSGLTVDSVLRAFRAIGEGGC